MWKLLDNSSQLVFRGLHHIIHEVIDQASKSAFYTTVSRFLEIVRDDENRQNKSVIQLDLPVVLAAPEPTVSCVRLRIKNELILRTEKKPKQLDGRC
jgi:hypothetical protein